MLVSLALLGAGACTDDFASGASDASGVSGASGASDESSDATGEGGAGPGGGDPGDGDPGGPGDPGDGDGDGDPLAEIPPEAWEDVPSPDGIPSPLPGVYDDEGAADPNDIFRSLIALHLRDRDQLEDFVLEVSDPNSALYGDYMSTQELLDNHAPTPSDFELLQAWLEFEGMSVNYLATNRQLIQFSGTVAQFNEAFNTTLHVCMRKNPQWGNPPIPVYCATQPMTLPLFVAKRSPGLVTADLPAAVGDLPNEIGEITAMLPNGVELGSRLTPDRVARAYNVDELYAMGYDGAGQKIGVVFGAHIHFKWAQSFWQSWGILRTNPDVRYMMEPPTTRYIESQLDSTWAGALAPGAELIAYEGPDARNTSMVFTFNEAVTRAQGDGVSVITDSFAHREDSEPMLVRNQYNDSGLVGAALGITLIAATGDSGQPDTPSSSPWVTGCGGTRLHLDGWGNVVTETTWSESGSGIAKSFEIPPWQVAVAGNIGEGDRRVVADVSAAASTASPYWVYYDSAWALYGGTSFGSPVWAGIIAVVNQYRDDNGMAPVGYLNQMLYTTPAVQATFRDVTIGATADFSAGPSWDAPTGWGTPDAAAFANTVPSP